MTLDRATFEFDSVRQDAHGALLAGRSVAGEPSFLRVQPIAPGILRVRWDTDGTFGPTLQERDGFLRAEWQPQPLAVTERDDTVLLEVPGLSLSVDRRIFQLTFAHDGEPLLRGVGAASRGERARLAWTSPTDERFLGFADQGAGHTSAFPPDRAPLDHRGQLIQMAGMSSHRHYYVPFYLSSRGYGFFLNTLRMSWWDLARSDADRIVIDVDEPRLDFYVFGATSLSAVLERYTDLVGRPPLPPKWFLGERISPKKHGIEIDGMIPEEGWNTRWFDQKEIEFAARTTRAAHTPCDFMHFDSPWQTIRNSFEWVSEVPDPVGLLSLLNRLHIKVDLWERATLAVGDYAVYREAEERGFLVKNADGTPFVCEQKYGGPSGMVDFTNPDAVIWWQELHAPLVAGGAWSFKLDSASSGFIEAYPELREARFHNGMTGKELEHYYGPLYMKTVWDGLRRQLNGRRVGLHVYHQTSFAGGRYPFVGLGDRGWQSPRETMIRYALNYGLTGVPFYQGGEYGSFGLPGGGTELRRRTMPYTYSYWRIAHDTGLPVTRALALEYQDDPNSYTADTQFLYGREFLVAPALEQGEAWRRVYLPRGEWVDYWSKERHMGPGWQLFRSSPGREPLFVRGGGIIPMAAPMEYVGQRQLNQLILDVYPCGESDFTLYEDDGETYAYEDGACARTRLTCRESDTSVELTIGPADGDYAGMPAQRSYVLEVHGTTRPARVTLDDAVLTAFADEPRAAARRRIVFGEFSGEETDETSVAWEQAASGWRYRLRNGFDRTVVVKLAPGDVRRRVTVRLEGIVAVRYYRGAAGATGRG